MGFMVPQKRTVNSAVYCMRKVMSTTVSIHNSTTGHTLQSNWIYCSQHCDAGIVFCSLRPEHDVSDEKSRSEDIDRH